MKKSHRSGTCKCGDHRVDERERRAEEYGALEFGKELIDDRACARAEQCSRSGHSVSDNCGNGNGRRHDGKQLLDRKYDQLTGFRSVVYIVDQFQNSLPPKKIYHPRQ